MIGKPLTDKPAKQPLRLPLRWVLVAPFVVQTFAAVGLTGWLAVRNGQKAVNELANELISENIGRVEQHIQAFSNTPHAFLKINEASILSGSINLENFPLLERYFWHQVQITDAISYVYYGNEQGEFLGIRRDPDGSKTLRIETKETFPRRRIYQLDAQGNRRQFLSEQEFDPRIRPWYRSAVVAGKPTWSPIYPFATSKSLGITPVLPIYGPQNQLRGVLAIDVTLTEISTFLQGLKLSKSGHIAIIERTGDLVASSSESPFVELEGQEKRLSITASASPVLRKGIESIQQKFANLYEIKTPELTTFTFNQRPQYLQISPIQDGRGLDWLVVIVIPESDFMAEINENTRHTILLCLVALATTILLGLITSRWIARPIHQLSQASQVLAQQSTSDNFTNEELNPTLVPVNSRVQEWAVLADIFNQMSEQVRTSFKQLEDYSRQQEQQIIDRTQALEQEIQERQLLEDKLHSSESKMRALFEAMTDVVLVLDAQGSIEVVPTNTTLLYHPDADVIGYTIEQFFSDEPGQIWLQHIRRALSSQQTITFDYSINLGDREAWFAARISPMSSESVIWVARDISDRKQTELALRLAQQQSEGLLLNILPKPIAEKLKKNTDAIAEYFDDVTILFADIVGFTPLSERMSPIELVNMLNRMFSKFDRLAEIHGLEKIKTIGDAYMVAGGLPVPNLNHAEAVANMALEMQEAMLVFQAEMGEHFQIRIGINSGPVVAGVIGIKKFIYDLWGDTVNVASRMESSGIPGFIQISTSTYDHLQGRYILEKRGSVSVKGKGPMTTYWLKGRK